MSQKDHPSQSNEIDAVAAEWIGRRDSGLTREETAELERWRTSDSRHGLALARFEALWTALGRPTRAGALPALRRELHTLARRQSRRRAIAAACVSIFMVAGITWLTQRATVPSPPSSPNQPVVFLPEHRMLPDGSRIDFPASTQFMVEFSGPLRRVILRHGEALFQVAKNPARPFVVEAGGVKVRAVGTAFSVQLSRESVEVLVTEGKVRVEPLRTSALVGQTAGAPAPTVGASVVAAGQCTVVSLATTGLMPSIVPVTPEEVARRLAWRNPRVEFSGTPLSAVITVLNRRNRVQFVIDPDSPALGATEVSGLFCTDDTAAFIRMLADGFGVKAEKRGPEEIVLHKEP